MAQRFEQGERVEVNKVWSAGGNGQPALRAWFGGYTFKKYDNHPVTGPSVLLWSEDWDVVVRFKEQDIRKEGSAWG